MPEYLPSFTPGRAITRTASATITGGQLVAVSGTGTVAPAATVTSPWIGVAGFDVTTGSDVTVYRGGVQRCIAAGAITAGANVEPAAAGTVASHTNGTNDWNIVGLALNTVTTGQLVDVSFMK